MIYTWPGTGPIVTTPTQPPPVHPETWAKYQKCTRCDVAWHSTDPRCWMCGQIDGEGTNGTGNGA